MRKTTLALFAVFMFATTLLAQTAKPKTPVANENDLGWGTVADGKFVSKRLGISFLVPAEFHVISTAEGKLLRDAGADLIKQEISSDKAFDAAINRTIPLVAIAGKPLGQLENPSLELVAAKQQTGVTAKMSLAANVMLLKGSQFTLKRSLGVVKLGTNSFSAAEFDVNVSGIKFFQRMYVIMQKNYSIVIGAAYFNEDQRIELEKVLASLSLTK